MKVDATDNGGLKRIIANVYKDGVLVKSTQTAINGASAGTRQATVALPDGAYTVKYNAQDLAGNISQTGTFAFTIDATHPTITLRTNGNLTVKTGETYDVISFLLQDAGEVDKAVINGVTREIEDDIAANLNSIRPGKFGARAGLNTLVVHDVAGNTQSLTFVLNRRPRSRASFSRETNVRQELQSELTPESLE